MKKHLNILFSSLLGTMLMFVALPLHAGLRGCPVPVPDADPGDPVYSYGDVNGDQSSNVLDLVTMLDEILELGGVIVDHPVEFCGDVNCDGKFKLGKTMKLSDHAEYTCAMGSGS